MHGCACRAGSARLELLVPPVMAQAEWYCAGMAEPEGQKQGGLHMLFTMVLGGLVGATPHMVAASVMALARLMYEFAGQLEALAPHLLPVILSLLRSKSREIIKSVLGFLKVALQLQPCN